MDRLLWTLEGVGQEEKKHGCFLPSNSAPPVHGWCVVRLRNQLVSCFHFRNPVATDNASIFHCGSFDTLGPWGGPTVPSLDPHIRGGQSAHICTSFICYIFRPSNIKECPSYIAASPPTSRSFQFRHHRPETFPPVSRHLRAAPQTVTHMAAILKLFTSEVTQRSCVQGVTT